MSQATKRKHVVKEVLGDFVTPTENQQIVKVSYVWTAFYLTSLITLLPNHYHSEQQYMLLTVSILWTNR